MPTWFWAHRPVEAYGVSRFAHLDPGLIVCPARKDHMSGFTTRALTVGTTVALAFLSLFIVPAHSAPASTPTTCAGVWVVVQKDETSPASSIGCATTYGTGLDALQSAGFASTVSASAYGPMLTQIDALPADPSYATNGGYYWSYWTAPVNADGTLGAWAYASSGPGTSTPAKGVAEGYLLTNGSAPAPAATRVFTPAATTSATASSSVTASAPASSASPSTSATTAASSSPSATVSKQAISAKAASAGAFINGHLPTADDGAAAVINAILGLSAADACTYAPTIRSLIANLKAQAVDYVGTNPGRAAKLAILASAIGEDPTSFAGLDLLAIVAAGTLPSGQVGTYASSFVQSYAVIAYVRAGQPVPPAVLSNLVASQDASGAFGYDFGGFNADYDTTGLAIQALHAAGGNAPAIAAAVAWALSQQNAQGYWPNPYSPVDSTGLLGSALELVGTSSGGATAWLESQQLADGGFPAAIGSTTSDLMATSDALWLLARTSLVSVTFTTSGCAATVVPSPGATATTLASLADTGATHGALGVGLVGVLVLGAGLVLVTRRRVDAR